MRLCANRYHIVGVDEDEGENKRELCRHCVMGKSARESRERSSNGILDRVTSRPVERIHTDKVGPMKRILMRKAGYFVNAVDENSGFSLIRFINKENETAIAVIEMTRNI